MLSGFFRCAGDRNGTNELYLSQDAPPDGSVSTVSVFPVLNGAFVRIDQGWACDGKPQRASFLIGFDPEKNAATVHWIDTFHVGRKVMAFIGTIGGDGTVDVRGSYPAPPGPDWGWEIKIEAAADRIAISMFNSHPDGKTELAVRSVYSRQA